MDYQVVESNISQEIAQKAATIKEKADAIAVVDQASYDAADALNNAARAEKKSFHAFFDPIDEASRKQRQAVISQGKAIDDPLDYVIKITGQKQAAWMRIEQARVEEERRQKEAEARKLAEEEQRKAAEVLKEAGLTNAAEAVLEAPVVIQKVDVSAPVKQAGTSYRTSYSAECVSLMDLVKAVAEGRAPICYLEVNQTAINGWAKTTKGTEELPGVRVVASDVQVKR